MIVRLAITLAGLVFITLAALNVLQAGVNAIMGAL